MIVDAQAVYAAIGVVSIILAIGWFMCCAVLTSAVLDEILRHGWWLAICWLFDIAFAFSAVYCIVVAGKL